MRYAAVVSTLLLTAAVMRAQARPQFEVASVRPSGAMPLSGTSKGGRGGGDPAAAGVGASCGIPKLTMDGGRVDFACIPLSGLIAYAYGGQVTGPDWMTDRDAQKFDVIAKLPQGASEAQVPEMFQSLLTERFRVAVHSGSKEQPVYALVLDKGGLKLKEAAADAPAPAIDPNPPPCPLQNFNCAPSIRNLGGVQTRSVPVTGQIRKISNPRIGMAVVTNLGFGQTRIEAPSTTLAGLADVLTLASQVGQPVMDETGDKRRYQVLLEVSVNQDLLRDAATAARAQAAAPGGPPAGPSDPTGNPFFVAYQNLLQKLGLRLEPRKGQVETIVVDRAEKAPTEN